MGSCSGRGSQAVLLFSLFHHTSNEVYGRVNSSSTICGAGEKKGKADSATTKNIYKLLPIWPSFVKCQ